MKSRLRIRVERRASGAAITELSSSGQLAARQTGPLELHLVSRAAGPLNGDRIEMDLAVGAGASLTVRSTAAMLALPAAGGGAPSLVHVRAEVGEDAQLQWLPEPTVVADGADLVAHSEWVLAQSARLHVRECVVLGRHGEAGGSWSGRTVLTWAGVQRLSQTLTSAVLDRTGSFTGTPERVVASGLLVGAPVPLCSCAGRYAVTTSPLPGLLVGTGVGPDLRSVTTDLAATLEGVPVPSAAR